MRTSAFDTDNLITVLFLSENKQVIQNDIQIDICSNLQENFFRYHNRTSITKLVQWPHKGTSDACALNLVSKKNHLSHKRQLHAAVLLHVQYCKKGLPATDQTNLRNAGQCMQNTAGSSSFFVLEPVSRDIILLQSHKTKAHSKLSLYLYTCLRKRMNFKEKFQTLLS
jgi:hypothetical protein